MSYRELKNKILSDAAGMLLEVEALNDDELKAQRIATCESCPNFDAENRRCKICTCFIDAKAGIKTNRNPLKLFRIELTHCPLGKWDDKYVANKYRSLDGKPLL